MQSKPSITMSEPYPLLDEGQYLALCAEADYAWSRQWKKWIARLVLEPQNYQGRPYTGRLCKFMGLGKYPERPFAGSQSEIRRLFVEVNRDQRVLATLSMDAFVGFSFTINVETVTLNRKGEKRPPEEWYSIVREIHLAATPSAATPDRRTTHLLPPDTSTRNSPTLQPVEPSQPYPQTNTATQIPPLAGARKTTPAKNRRPHREENAQAQVG